MTTTVIVKANHGWPVRVRQIDPATGNTVPGSERIVPAGEVGDFVCHSHADLDVHEIQPGEEDFDKHRNGAKAAAE